MLLQDRVSKWLSPISVRDYSSRKNALTISARISKVRQEREE